MKKTLVLNLIRNIIKWFCKKKQIKQKNTNRSTNISTIGKKHKTLVEYVKPLHLKQRILVQYIKPLHFKTKNISTINKNHCISKHRTLEQYKKRQYKT